MLGPAILVHPVLQQGAASVTVYLPQGVWYDMDTNVKHVGPTTFEYPVSMADTPTFIRGGHVVVRRDRARRSTVAMAADPFTIVVAPDAAGHAVGELYLDDGKSFGFEKGAFVRRALTFTAFGKLACGGAWQTLFATS